MATTRTHRALGTEKLKYSWGVPVSVPPRHGIAVEDVDIGRRHSALLCIR